MKKESNCGKIEQDCSEYDNKIWKTIKRHPDYLEEIENET